MQMVKIGMAQELGWYFGWKNKRVAAATFRKANPTCCALPRSRSPSYPLGHTAPNPAVFLAGRSDPENNLPPVGRWSDHASGCSTAPQNGESHHL